MSLSCAEFCLLQGQGLSGFNSVSDDASPDPSSSENTTDEYPSVCVCLDDIGSAECSTAAARFTTEEPEWKRTFLRAQKGNEDSIEDVRTLLREDLSCGEDGTEQGADVCTCLLDTDDPLCQKGVVEVLADRPDLAQSFADAASGSAQAQAYLAGILLEDYDCSFGKRKLLDHRDSGEVSNTKGSEGDDPENTKGIQRSPSSSEDHSNLSRSVSLENTVTEAEVPLVPEISYSAEASTSRVGIQTKKEAKALLHNWEQAWQREISNKVQPYKYIDVQWAASSSLDDTARQAGKAQGPLLGIGYILVLAYVVLFFTFDCNGSKIQIKSTPPGPLIAMLGFFSILTGMLATFGIIGLLSLSSIKASSITVQIVPLLMVGLGINDFFVLARSVSSAAELMPKSCCIDIMEAAMASGGISVTLSSASNAAAFALGALSPIPAVQWFSIHMMIGVVVAYFVSMTVIPCLLAWATQRWVDGLPDPLLTFSTRAREGIITFAEREEEEPPNTPMSNAMHVKLADSPPVHATGKPPCTVAYTMTILGLFLGMLGISIWGITCLGQGLNPSEAVPKDGDLYKYLKPSEKYFQSYPIYVVFRAGQNFSDPAVFEAAREAEFQFVVNGYKVDTTAKVTSWMEYYLQYVEGKMCANEVCLSEVEWIQDGFAAEQFGEKDICKGLQTPAECPDACANHCPQALTGSQFACQLSTDQRSCYCPWRPKMKPYLFYRNPMGFNSSIQSFWADFLANTTGGAVSKSLMAFDGSTVTPENNFGEVLASRSLAFVKDVPDVQQKLQHLKRGREILDKSAVKVFPFDYTVSIFLESFICSTSRTSYNFVDLPLDAQS